MVNSLYLASKLDFLKVEEYEYNNHYTFDVSNCPRPHFCMGLVTEGRGVFTDSEYDRRVEVVPGDIIFVPVSSRYISSWTGEPKIKYISMHFMFGYPSSISKQQNFMLQKITVGDFEKRRSDFEFMLGNYDKDGELKLSVLSRFYDILSEIFPQLMAHQIKILDERMNKAVLYMEKNYDKDISVDTLAAECNMSASRFFPCFKKALGMTPIEYLNNHRVNRAMLLLINGDKLSVEEISDAVGFESAAYFRRVFKKVTGKTPRDYRKTAMEI